MKRFLAGVCGIFLLFSMIFMSSCGETDYESPRESFEADIYFSRDGVDYAARVSVGERRVVEGRTAVPRAIEMSFTAPESMVGVRLLRSEGGDCRTVCGGVELEGDVGGWLGLAELLIASDVGRLVDIQAGRGAAEGRTMAEFLLNDGRRCVVYVDNASGFPISVVCDGEEVGVIFASRG